MSAEVKMTWDGDTVTAEARDAMLDGLFEAAQELLRLSGEEVPFEEGVLDASGVVDIDDVAGEATVSYGEGPAGQYAVRQHEDLTYTHQNGRKAKYLEDPLNENGGRLIEHVAGKVRGVLGG